MCNKIHIWWDHIISGLNLFIQNNTLYQLLSPSESLPWDLCRCTTEAFCDVLCLKVAKCTMWFCLMTISLNCLAFNTNLNFWGGGVTQFRILWVGKAWSDSHFVCSRNSGKTKWQVHYHGGKKLFPLFFFSKCLELTQMKFPTVVNTHCWFCCFYIS